MDAIAVVVRRLVFDVHDGGDGRFAIVVEMDCQWSTLRETFPTVFGLVYRGTESTLRLGCLNLFRLLLFTYHHHLLQHLRVRLDLLCFFLL